MSIFDAFQIDTHGNTETIIATHQETFIHSTTIQWAGRHLFVVSVDHQDRWVPSEEVDLWGVTFLEDLISELWAITLGVWDPVDPTLLVILGPGVQWVSSGGLHRYFLWISEEVVEQEVGATSATSEDRIIRNGSIIRRQIEHVARRRRLLLESLKRKRRSFTSREGSMSNWIKDEITE